MNQHHIESINESIDSSIYSPFLEVITKYKAELIETLNDPYITIDHIGLEIVNRNGSKSREFAVTYKSTRNLAENEPLVFHKLYWVKPFGSKITDPEPFEKTKVVIE